MRRLFWSLGIVSFALAAGSAAWGSARVTWSVSVGALLGAANLYLIATIVRGLLGQGRVKKGRITAAFVAKLLILLAIIGLILLKGGVRPLPFLFGLSNIPLTMLVVAAAGRMTRRA